MKFDFKIKKAFSKLVFELLQFKHKFYNPARLQTFDLDDDSINDKKNLPMVLEYARETLDYMKKKYGTHNVYQGYHFLSHANVMQEQFDILDPVVKRIIRGKELNHSEEFEFIEIIDEKNISDKSYEEVVAEINGTYNDEYFTSMYIMVRKLLENLLYDCLKKYYNADVDKYYNTPKGQHQGFGTLIGNFNDMIRETRFKTDVGDIEQRFIDLLKEFQEKGNKDAHSLFNLPHQDFIEERKGKINNLIKKLDWILQKL
ncbi:hypothetical protein LCGC14_0730180 [marine sediment metagenome]|uniref:Uncharacterized protein n=1 Tax=marine sediment metagenome TaxID=412755 RepID=A0A0F9TH24_9ZZZZ